VTPCARSWLIVVWSPGASVITLRSRRGGQPVGADGPELLRAAHDVGVGGTADQEPLHGGLVRVAGGQPLLRMDAAEPEEVQIGGDARGRLRGAAPHAATECLNSRPPRMTRRTVGVLGQRRRRGRAVRDDRRGQVGPQRPGDLDRRRAAVEYDGRARVIISAALDAMRRLLSGAISVRA